jgi:hypothetical protein
MEGHYDERFSDLTQGNISNSRRVHKPCISHRSKEQKLRPTFFRPNPSRCSPSRTGGKRDIHECVISHGQTETRTFFRT